MKKLLILGGTGMLGSAVSKYFSKLDGYNVTITHRTSTTTSNDYMLCFDALSTPLDTLGGPYDYVINCIGIIKPYMASNLPGAIRINSLFPWELSAWCSKADTRLIHITTDCVYSGLKGKYTESDLHDALDDYGKSKSLGECSGAMVLRTSIIGEELHKFVSLISWAKSQKGKTVNGFSTHLWNGVTTNHYAKICHEIISGDLFEEGLFHVFAADDVSKFQMLNFINERFKLGLDIKEITPETVDRTLRTEKTLCAKLNIPTVYEMIKDL